MTRRKPPVDLRSIEYHLLTPAQRGLLEKQRRRASELRKAQLILKRRAAEKAKETKALTPDQRAQREIRKWKSRAQKAERALEREKAKADWDDTYRAIQKNKGQIKRGHQAELHQHKGSKGYSLEENVNQLWMEFQDFDIYEDIGELYDLYSDE